MDYYSLAIIISLISYMLILYLIYLVSFLLLNSLNSWNIKMFVRSVLFFVLGYIFIITDLVLYASFEYLVIVHKGVIFIFIVILGYNYAKKERNKRGGT